MTKINLNDIIKVKLTDRGKDIFYHQHDEFNQCARKIIKPSYPKVDEEGFTSFQLWYFMQLYGPHIHMGMDNFIEHNNIYFEEG